MADQHGDRGAARVVGGECIAINKDERAMGKYSKLRQKVLVGGADK
jgi:hypothetical protein